MPEVDEPEERLLVLDERGLGERRTIKVYNCTSGSRSRAPPVLRCSSRTDASLYPCVLSTTTQGNHYQSYLPFFPPPPGVYGFLKSAWSTAVKSRFIPGERAVSTLLGSFAVARTGRGWLTLTLG